jgi:hypothetical protein
VWLGFVLLLTIYHHPQAKTFCLGNFLTRKKDACHFASIFFVLCKKAPQAKSFCFRMMKNYQHNGKPHTQEK